MAEGAAATALAAAASTAGYLLGPPGLTDAARAASAVALALAIFVTTILALRRVGTRKPRFEIPSFEPPVMAIEDVPELVLTDAHRLQRAISELSEELLLTDADRVHPAVRADDELVLDDILAELGPDSRVVRLFDPAAMPTPGQLNARIERHLHGNSSANADADASQALYEALSDLRRSLR